MKKLLLCIMALLVPPGASAEEESPHSFSANVSVSTDYRFRGISQTTNDPAISGGMDYAYASEPVGIFLGLWASNIDFGETGVSDTADMEIDFYGGLTGTLPVGSGLGWTLGGLYYAYPGSDPSPALTVDYDYFEAYGNLSYDFGSFNVGAGVNYSPDYFAETGDGWYYYGDVGIPLPMDFELSGHVGRQEIDDNASFGTPDYTDWNIGIAKTWKFFALKLSYVDTDLSDSECFSGTDFCDGTALFSVTAAY